MAVEDDDLCCAELVRSGQLRSDFPSEGRIGGEKPEGDQAVALAAAHGLGEIERAVIALAGKPFEAALDQQFQPGGEIVAPKRLATVDFAGGEILYLSDLLDEAVAGYHCAWYAKLLDGGNAHRGKATLPSKKGRRPANPLTQVAPPGTRFPPFRVLAQ